MARKNSGESGQLITKNVTTRIGIKRRTMVGCSSGRDNSRGGKNNNTSSETEKLEILAAPMDVRGFSREEYRLVFPQGTVKTPVGEVKIGKNQFEKMSDKDNGKRRSLIGAMRQTLTDPITIIQEENGGKTALVFIKSFKNTENPQKPDFIMAVVVAIGNAKVAISIYKRKRREVLNKIKKAGVIAYEKDYGANRTNGHYPATSNIP
jgi:hypothetical protein